MSLFKWSTPERRSEGGRVLPIIPNEIYLHLFDYIAPPNECLMSGELRVFTNLSRVCRFFANVCLPRVFHFVEISGSIFRDDANYKPLRGNTLCTQIAAKQPLALALAKTVRACCFTGWRWQDGTTGAWAVRLFASTYIDALSHMTHVRELAFHESFVDSAHWRAIAMLDGGGGLEKLSFVACTFLGGPANARTKIKVSRLCMTQCSETGQPVAAVDLRCLRTLVMDADSLEQFDWLSKSTLRELHVHFRTCLYTIRESFLKPLHAVLAQTPRSLEALWLFTDVEHIGVDHDQVGHMFDDPAWQNVPHLRSLTLSVRCLGAPRRVVSSTLESIPRLTQLQSFTLKDDWILTQSEVPPLEILRILRGKLGTTSNFKHVEIFGVVFRLADGEWSKVSDVTKCNPNRSLAK